MPSMQPSFQPSSKPTNMPTSMPSTAMQSIVTFSANMEMEGISKEVFLASSDAFKYGLSSTLPNVRPQDITITNVTVVYTSRRRLRVFLQGIKLLIEWEFVIILENSAYEDVEALFSGLSNVLATAVSSGALLTTLAEFSIYFQNTTVSVALNPNYLVTVAHTPGPSKLPTSMPTSIFLNKYLAHGEENIKQGRLYATVSAGAIITIVLMTLSICIRDHFQRKKNLAMTNQIRNAQIERLRYQEEQRMAEEIETERLNNIRLATYTENRLRTKLAKTLSNESVFKKVDVAGIETHLEALALFKSELHAAASPESPSLAIKYRKGWSEHLERKKEGDKIDALAQSTSLNDHLAYIQLRDVVGDELECQVFPRHATVSLKNVSPEIASPTTENIKHYDNMEDLQLFHVKSSSCGYYSSLGTRSQFEKANLDSLSNRCAMDFEFSSISAESLREDQSQAFVSLRAPDQVVEAHNDAVKIDFIEPPEDEFDVILGSTDPIQPAEPTNMSYTSQMESTRGNRIYAQTVNQDGFEIVGTPPDDRKYPTARLHTSSQSSRRSVVLKSSVVLPPPHGRSALKNSSTHIIENSLIYNDSPAVIQLNEIQASTLLDPEKYERTSETIEISIMPDPLLPSSKMTKKPSESSEVIIDGVSSRLIVKDIDSGDGLKAVVAPVYIHGYEKIKTTPIQQAKKQATKSKLVSKPLFSRAASGVKVGRSRSAQKESIPVSTPGLSASVSHEVVTQKYLSKPKLKFPTPVLPLFNGQQVQNTTSNV